jgi:hypothetical protein
LTLLINYDAGVSASANNTEVCIGGDATLTAIVTNGSSEAIVQWQSGTSSTGPWENIVGATNMTFVSPTGTEGTFYYRAGIVDDLSGCEDPFSNVLTIIVNPDILVTASADFAEVCVGGFVTLSADIVGGSASIQYHWQSSPDGTNLWTDVSVSNMDYVVAPSSAGVYYYRVRIEDVISGCLETFSDPVTITVLPDATVSASADFATACEGQVVTLTATVSGGSPALSYHWQSSPNGSTGWTDIGVSNMPYNPPTGVNGIYYFRVRISDPNTGCAQPNSSVVTLTILDPAAGTVSASNPQICVGGISTLSAAITGGSASKTYHWQLSSDGLTGWTDLGAANGPYGINGAAGNNIVPGTYYYRVRIADNAAGCPETFSNVISFIINPDGEVSIAGSHTEVCIGEVVTMTATLTGGSTQFGYIWQVSNTGTGSWSDVGVSNATYNPPTNIANTRYYRVRTIDGISGCPIPVSNVLQLVVRTPATASASVNNTQICLGGTSLLTATVTGGSTQRTYHWQSSPDGSAWTDIGVSNSNYTFNPSVAGTTHFRIRVSDPVAGCAEPFSNAVIVNVYNDAVATVSASQSQVCLNEPVTLSANITGGSPALVYHWQLSLDGSTGWSDVGTSNGNYVPPTGVAGIRYYRVRVVDTAVGCAQPNSTAISVQVFTDATVSASTSAPQVCVDGTATLTAIVNGGAFGATYHWQSSPDGTTNWTDVGVANGPYNAPTSVVGQFYYRVRVEDTVAGCDDPESNVLTIVVNPDAEISALVDNAEVCVDGSAILSANLTGGSPSASIQWQSSLTSGGTFTDIVGATSSTYAAPTIGTGTTYYRVRVIDPNSDCATPNSNEVSVTVLPDALITANVDNAEICVDGTALLSANLSGGSSAATLQWQNSSTFAGTYNDIAGATDATYSAPSATPGVTYYRVRVIDPNSDCSDPISNVASVTVQPDAIVSVSVNNSEVCVGGVAQLSATVTGGSSARTLQWESSTNMTTGFTPISGATNNVYNAPTASAGVLYYRLVVTDINSDCADPVSNVVSVTVNADAQINITTADQEVCVGGVALLEATLTGGSADRLHRSLAQQIHHIMLRQRLLVQYTIVSR